MLTRTARSGLGTLRSTVPAGATRAARGRLSRKGRARLRRRGRMTVQAAVTATVPGGSSQSGTLTATLRRR